MLVPDLILPSCTSGPRVARSALVSMGDDGIAVGGGFLLVVVVDSASMSVTLAMPATGPMCATAPLEHEVVAGCAALNLGCDVVSLWSLLPLVCLLYARALRDANVMSV